MKATHITMQILLLVLPSFAIAQEQAPTTQTKLKSASRIEAGLLFAGYTYEQPIVGQLAIQGGLQYNVNSFVISTNNGDNEYNSQALFHIEPRFYYSFNKRVRKEKNTKNNAANFISVKVDYMPAFLNNNYFEYRNGKKEFVNAYSWSPMWNMRRNMGKSNFSYEIGAGLTFETIAYKQSEHTKNTSLTLRAAVTYGF